MTFYELNFWTMITDYFDVHQNRFSCLPDQVLAKQTFFNLTSFMNVHKATAKYLYFIIFQCLNLVEFLNSSFMNMTVNLHLITLGTFESSRDSHLLF